jgi:transcriptional regulator with XRE-family HTH domain
MTNKEASEVFGERVRRKRLMCGLTQKALAERLGVPPTHVSKLESGYYLSIEFGEIHQLLEALLTNADYLLGLSNDPGEIPAGVLVELAL